ncbi:DDE_3 domain-containing protein [Trichonephila clavipes]|nr:DDE_3 domain-containing protein [Trichonephila clavipes]
MTEYTQRSDASWEKQNNKRKEKLREKDRRATQSLDFNIVKPLWSVLESSIRSRYSKPASLPKLSQLLHEEWHIIPLKTIQLLYESIPRRIQASLHTESGSTPY